MDLIVNQKFEGKRLEELLNFYHVSKATIYKIHVDKLLLVNGKPVRNDYILKESDVLTFSLNEIEPNIIIPHKGDIKILYEDDDILIVNKPAYLLVHSDGITLDTLANRVASYAIKSGYEGTIKHVHRIDYETSGMVIFAKHFLAHSYLGSLFESRNITKTYVCLCHHKFKDLDGVIDAKIGKDRHDNKQRISKTGKEALSKYHVLKNDLISRVQIEIIGGRKHQIRVHLASINHPIVGDKLYGKGEERRLLLHFKKVNFIHPRTLKPFEFTCNEDF